MSLCLSGAGCEGSSCWILIFKSATVMLTGRSEKTMPFLSSWDGPRILSSIRVRGEMDGDCSDCCCCGCWSDADMLAATTRRRLAGREAHEQKEWSSEVDGQLYAQDCRLWAK